MLGVCCFMPIVIGGYWDSPLGRRIVSESAYVFSMVTTVLITIAYGTSVRVRALPYCPCA